MSKPVRIQRRRVKGFDLQAQSHRVNGLPCISVTRPGRFGNHWQAWKDGLDGRWWVSDGGCHHGPFSNKAVARAKAVELYRRDITEPGQHHHRYVNPVPTPDDAVKYLRGNNLACTCGPAEPCHADVLLELANK